jgi:hypothetical protein
MLEAGNLAGVDGDVVAAVDQVDERVRRVEHDAHFGIRRAELRQQARQVLDRGVLRHGQAHDARGTALQRGDLVGGVVERVHRFRRPRRARRCPASVSFRLRVVRSTRRAPSAASNWASLRVASDASMFSARAAPAIVPALATSTKSLARSRDTAGLWLPGSCGDLAHGGWRRAVAWTAGIGASGRTRTDTPFETRF